MGKRVTVQNLLSVPTPVSSVRLLRPRLCGLVVRGSGEGSRG